jgi:acyl carrier protein
MGSFPELNSLTVVALVAGIEEQLGCEIGDTEISGEIFETFGTLTAFVESKL